MSKAAKTVLGSVLSIMLTFSSIGCATTKGLSKDAQIQQLQAQVYELEKQLQEKERVIDNLEAKLIDAREAKAPKKATVKKPKTLSRTPKNIQTALRNAKFYKGPLDGKIGKDTTKAVREFQKANGLTEDGVVGKNTWLKLKKYLS